MHSRYDQPPKRASTSSFGETAIDHPKMSSTKSAYDSSYVDGRTSQSSKSSASKSHALDISYDEDTNRTCRSPLPKSDDFGSIDRRSRKHSGNSGYDNDELRNRKISQNSDVFPPVVPKKPGHLQVSQHHSFCDLKGS